MKLGVEVRLIILLCVALVDCGKGKTVFTSGASTAVSPLDDSGPTSSLGSASQPTAPESKIRLLTRSYVASTLNGVFGPSAAPVTQALISRTSAMGGSVDPYSAPDLTEGLETQGALIPLVTTSREAYRTRACERLVANDVTLSHAIGLSRGEPSLASLSFPSQAEILNSFHLFFPGKATSFEALSALEAISNEARAKRWPHLEAWRFIFLTLCLAPDWQVP